MPNQKFKKKNHRKCIISINNKGTNASYQIKIHNIFEERQNYKLEMEKITKAKVNISILF